MSLATKYRPRTFDSVTEQETIINIVSKLCDQDDLENRNFLFIGPSGTGKAQPLYSKVLTPKGYIQMKDVEEGTVVFAGDGYSYATVDKVFPQGVRDIYQITLSDGSKFEVADNHLNSVFFVDDFGNEVDTVVDTLTLIEMLKHHEWVGIRNIRVDGTLNPRDFMQDFPTYSHLYENLVKMLKDGTLPENFYLIGSQNLSTFLSQILLRNTSCEFESSQYVVDFRNREASIAFTNLVRALGYVDIVSFVDRLDNPENNGYYRHEVYFDTFRIIENIEFFERSECKCIYVDHPEHTYLTDNFTLTHNTTTARIMASVLNGGSDKGTIEMDAASHNGVDSVREIINQARTFPVGTKYKVFIIDECFPAGTFVYTGSGTREIEKIQPGDHIFNKHGNSIVKNVFRNAVLTSRLIRLNFNNKHIITTVDHKFYTSEGWVEAQNLTPGTQMYTYSDQNFTDNVVFMSSEKFHRGKNDDLFTEHFSISELYKDIVFMYDLEVESDDRDGHSYYVDDILVSNCHSFSPQAWQIWLKPLEDAPAKSIFIYCTTNPEKIPATILSRVQTFQLSKISLKGIYDRLMYVIEQENKEGAGITYTEDAVNFIAKLANGGMRASLTDLEKVLAFTHDLTSESVAKALNLPEYDDYFKLLGAYSKKDNKSVSEVINDVYNSGVNFVKWFEGFHSFVMNVVKYIFLQDINLTMIPSHYQDKIAKYGTAHSIVCLKLANKLIKLNYELKTTQYLQEVALTYLCQIPKKESK